MYPNLTALLETLNPQERTMANMGLMLLDADILAQIDSVLPALATAYETGGIDAARGALILQGFDSAFVDMAIGVAGGISQTVG